MKVNLDDLHAAFSSWTAISDHVRELHLRCEDLYNSLKDMSEKIDNKDIKNLRYLQRVTEHLLEESEEEGNRLSIDNYDDIATDLFLAQENVVRMCRQEREMAKHKKYDLMEILRCLDNLIGMRQDLDCYVYQLFGNEDDVNGIEI